MGGTVAEWSKALQLREKINENKKDPRFAPWPGQPFFNPLGLRDYKEGGFREGSMLLAKKNHRGNNKPEFVQNGA